MNENFAATQEALGLSRADIHRLARNAFVASFLDDAAKGRRLGEVDDYFATAR